MSTHPNSTWRNNRQLAMQTLSDLQGLGVQMLILCPGARNSPWIEALQDSSAGWRFEVLNHFEERAAGFFALGRARATNRPVAVLTTSGTAVGELLPAVMEAHYVGAKLVLMTADRPRRYRGTGAPQACEQRSIFGVYCRESLDIDGAGTEHAEAATTETRGLPGPVHWNVCFEEPQSEKATAVVRADTETPATSDLSEATHPLVIVGELTKNESRIVSTVLRNWGYPVITEALSQLATDPSLDDLRIHAHRGLWKEALDHQYPINAVIRIGGVPTLRFWRDLDVHPEASKIPVLSISSLPFSGLPRAKALRMAVSDLYRLTVPVPRFAGTDSHRGWRDANHEQRRKCLQSLADHPASEPGVFRTLSSQIPEDALVYLGNSLPIREWDLASHGEARLHGRTIAANRGVNGIDGQLSTFFGMLSADSSESWAILGDLTTLYDSTAPWAIQQLARSGQQTSPWHLAIIQNSGGRIFERVFRDGARDSYINAHSVTFGHWAAQWELTHARVEAADLPTFLRDSRLAGTLPQVLEIVTDAAETEAFWKEVEGS